MDEKKNIYETINAVMGEIGAIGKEKKNQQQGFMYRGVDDVMNTLNPAFIKHRLFIVPEVLEQRREERQTGRGGNLIYSVCKVKYTFYAADGSSLTTVVVGEGMDSGDKASNKALSVAFKYACFQVFCIPTEEMKDPDKDSPPASIPSEPQRKNNNPPKPQMVNDNDISDMMKECERTGLGWRYICEQFGVSKLSDMTKDQYRSCMKRFQNTPTKAKDQTSASEGTGKEDKEELPWETPSR